MSGHGCMREIKIGEVARPSTYKLPKAVPKPTSNEEAWAIKSQLPKHTWLSPQTTSDLATSTAQAWLSHPANKMQLPSLQKAADTDGDGVISVNEFKTLLKSAGSGTDADLLFASMDADGDGVLTEAEIKALGQDSTGKAANRAGGM